MSNVFKKLILLYQVKTFFKSNFINVEYKINKELAVDIFGSLDLSSKNLTKLPFQFGEIHGSFSCSDNHLSSLKNAPKIVRGNFICKDNKLKSLDFSPIEVYGNYVASNSEESLHKELCSIEVYKNLEEKNYTLIAPWFKSLPNTKVGNFLTLNRLMISSDDLLGLLEAKSLAKRILDFKEDLDWSLNISKSIPHKPFKV